MKRRFRRASGILPRLEHLEERNLLTQFSSVNFDFGTPTSPVAPGWVGASATPYNVSQGYGWLSVAGMGSTNRGGSDPMTSDFVTGRDNTFAVDVPNGTYLVQATVGDPTSIAGLMTVWAEGSVMGQNVLTKPGQVAIPSRLITVTDGQLDVRITSNITNYALDGLSIHSVAPTASAGPALSSNEGSPVTFQGTASGSGNLTYSWNFGDGTGANGTLTPQHTYQTAGNYTATLTVSNGSTSAQSSTAVQVALVPPTASITGAPSTSPEGTAIGLGSVVTDPSTAETAAGFAESWSVTKDGAAYATGSGASFSFTPNDNGTYVVTLSATDNEGAVSLPATQTIAVTNVVPTAQAGGPYTAVSGQPLTLLGTASDPSPVDTSAGLTYTWNFGDGTAPVYGLGLFSPTHIYSAAGAYTITLTVTDKDGGSAVANATASVGPVSTGSTPSPAVSTPTMVLQNFNGSSVPTNGSGDTYPSSYYSSSWGGGVANVSIDPGAGPGGSNALDFSVTSGALYMQFNPYNADGTRSFARDYSSNPAGWQFNTYDRMSFWIKRPTTAAPLRTDGGPNLELGDYVKQVTNADPHSDETGGEHYYTELNVPNSGQWTQVIVNMHPDHLRGTSGGVDPGFLPYPTTAAYGGDDPAGTYNFFDTLTRFYLSDYSSPSAYPADYQIADIQFYKAPSQENDVQVYALTGTYNQSSNDLTITWNRQQDDNTTADEVRYSFTDIHQSGWDAATPAPNGVINPLGWQGYNNMIYDSSALPLAGHSVVYIAIKPQNSNLFSEIAVPISSLAGSGSTAPVATSPPAPVSTSPPASSTFTFDFGGPNMVVAPGAIGVSTQTYSAGSVGYGWESSGGLDYRDRGTGLPTSDFVMGTDATFDVDLPDGQYDVTATLGDSDYAHNQGSILANDQQVATGLTSAAGQSVQPKFRVTVVGGKLRLTFLVGDPSDVFTLNSISIQPATS